MRHINVLDTTLRDGEQTRGVSFSTDEKLHIAQELLSTLHVDRIEVASCKVGAKEHDSLCAIMKWAIDHGYQDCVEVLSFVDHTESFQWLSGTGCRRVNLLAKGSRTHCEQQLKKTLDEHCEDIRITLNEAHKLNMSVSVYLEDWSQGMQQDQSYVMEMLTFLSQQTIERVHLCDTLGILSPMQVTKFVSSCVNAYPNLTFDFHGHNDYALANANILAAVEAGASGIHVTVNGLGERAGNASLSEAVVALRDFGIATTNIDETKLLSASQLCETYSQKMVPDNAPIVGKNAFTHVSGIHVDGQEKANLYEGRLMPQRFGRLWEYGLNKLSGRKALEVHLKSLDSYDLSVEDQKRILDKIKDMQAYKKDITNDDLHALVKEVRGR